MSKFFAVLVALLFASFDVRSDEFQDCIDKAWDDYTECSGKCLGNLRCQSKCSAQKVKDLKACNVSVDKKFRVANRPTSTMSTAAGCVVDRKSLGTVLYLELRQPGCNEPQAVTIQWVNADGSTNNVTYHVGYRGRRVSFQGSGLNEHPTVSVEPMKKVVGGDATTLITSRKESRGSVSALFLSNGTNRYIAASFEIRRAITSVPEQHNTVLPPQTELPVFSESEPWEPIILGAQTDPQ